MFVCVCASVGLFALSVECLLRVFVYILIVRQLFSDCMVVCLCVCMFVCLLACLLVGL